MRGPTAHPQLLAETKKPRIAAPCTAIRQTGNGLRARERSDRFLELLGRAERDFLAGLDLDRLAGRRIASHPGGAVAHLQDAKPDDAQAVAFLQVLDDASYHVVEDRLRLFFRDFMALGKLRREMLEGDGRLGLPRFLGCHCRSTPVRGACK